ncbi:MAG: hypothetical protein FJ134_07130 [Deltaproteobacteria bacterium]|nr:hypothetical protein [Deltaproteobacteria bacterium]
MNRIILVFFWLFLGLACCLPAAQADYYYHLDVVDSTGGHVHDGSSLTFPSDVIWLNCTSASVQGYGLVHAHTQYESWGGALYYSNAEALLWYVPGEAVTANVTFNGAIGADGLLNEHLIKVTGKDFSWERTAPGSYSFSQSIPIDPDHPLSFSVLVSGGLGYYAGDVKIDNIQVQYSEPPHPAVPLPATWWMFLSGLAGGAWWWRPGRS